MSQKNFIEKAAEPNIERLKEAVKQIPKMKQVMEFIVNGRDRARLETTLPTLRRQPEMRKIDLQNEDIHRIFDAWESAGVGIKMRSEGRKTDYITFRWYYNMQDVACAALGRKLPEGRFRPPVYTIELAEKIQAQQAAQSAVSLNMQRHGFSSAPRPEATVSRMKRASRVQENTPEADGDIVVIRRMIFGKLMEIELDLAKVPNEAFRNIRPVT